MRRAPLVVAWLIVLLGARMLLGAPGALARGDDATAMALVSVGMVLVLAGGLSAAGGRRRASWRASRRGASVPRSPTHDEWESPSGTRT